MAVDVLTGPERFTTPSGARLLDVLPALRSAVPRDDLRLAHRALTVPSRTFARGQRFGAPSPAQPGRPFLAVIVDGLALRGTYLTSRGSGELLGVGDLIELANGEDSLCTLPATTTYDALEPVTIALLDDRFRTTARRWPRLHDVLADQRSRQARRAARYLAALSLPRVEDRIIALFCDLADRWGRVTPDGVRIGIPLTHTTIGRVTAARRPTVSLALSVLNDAGQLRREDDGTWLLRPDRVELS